MGKQCALSTLRLYERLPFSCSQLLYSCFGTPLLRSPSYHHHQFVLSQYAQICIDKRGRAVR